MFVLLHVLPYLVPILGVAGTCLIFYFGIPRKIDTAGKVGMCLEQEDEEEKRKIKKYKTWGNLGLILIGSSFLFQIVNQILLDLNVDNLVTPRSRDTFSAFLS